jgi:hypothetical protein
MVRAVEFATVKCNLLRGWRVVQTWMLWFGEFVPEPCLRQKADAAPAAAYGVTTSLVSRGVSMHMPNNLEQTIVFSRLLVYNGQ